MHSFPEWLLKMRAGGAARLVFFTIAFSAAAHAQSPQVDEQPAQHALKRFMQLCVSSLGDRKKVEEVAPQLGLRRLDAEAASNFVGKADASVWIEKNESGDFAVAAGAGEVCSVFVRRVNAASLIAAFSIWLPPKESEFETEPLPFFYNRNQTTISYNIKRQGQPFAVWALTTTTVENVVYQGVISMRKL